MKALRLQVAARSVLDVAVLDLRSDGSGELSGRRLTMQKIAYAASNRLPTLLKDEPVFAFACLRRFQARGGGSPASDEIEQELPRPDA